MKSKYPKARIELMGQDELKAEGIHKQENALNELMNKRSLQKTKAKDKSHLKGGMYHGRYN